MMKARHHTHPRQKTKKPPRATQLTEAAELVFSGKDFTHHEKNHYWYVGIGVLGITIIALLFYQHEYQLVLVTGALLLAMFRLANLEPRQRTVKINHRGVQWGDEFYAYFQLKAFWLANMDTAPTVYLERLNFAPDIHFVIPQSRTEEVVSFLMEHIPWHTHRNEPLPDQINRLLRF